MRERSNRDPSIEETIMRIVTYVASVSRKEADLVAQVFAEATRRMNALGVAEAAAVRVLAFFPERDGTSFYDSVTMIGTRS